MFSAAAHCPRNPYQQLNSRWIRFPPWMCFLAGIHHVWAQAKHELCNLNAFQSSTGAVHDPCNSILSIKMYFFSQSLWSHNDGM